MAEIKMDVSEYELLKENKAQLEKALEREKELNSNIETLNKEKIKVLEDAKMKVVKITKVVREEHLLQRRNDISYLGHQLNVHRFRDSESLLAFIINKGPELFYEKVTATSTPTEEVTFHGLDEIKIEIRSNLGESLDKEITEKLKQSEENSIKIKELITENSQLRADITFQKILETEQLDKIKQLKLELDDKKVRTKDEVDLKLKALVKNLTIFY